MIKLPKIALGTWAWGNDGMFGAAYTEDQLRPIFDAAMQHGLTLWDTAYAYGIGTAEKTLGAFLKGRARETAFSSRISSHRSAWMSHPPVPSRLCGPCRKSCSAQTASTSTGCTTQLRHRSGSSALRDSSRKRSTRPSSVSQTTTSDRLRRQKPSSNIMD